MAAQQVVGLLSKRGTGSRGPDSAHLDSHGSDLKDGQVRRTDGMVNKRSNEEWRLHEYEQEYISGSGIVDIDFNMPVAFGMFYHGW